MPMRHHFVVAAIIAATTMTAACGSATDNPQTTPSVSVDIVGRTIVDGGCPVIDTASPCPPRPLSAHVSAVTPTVGTTVAETTSDSQGNFRLSVPPGTYELRARNTTGADRPIAPTTTVTITDTPVNVTITFDSGVRSAP
jgi:hypothetical protein